LTNPVFHYPESANGLYDNKRDGNLQQKIFYPAFNNAFILSTYSRAASLKLSFSTWCCGDRTCELRIVTSAIQVAGLASWIALHRLSRDLGQKNSSSGVQFYFEAVHGHIPASRSGREAR